MWSKHALVTAVVALFHTALVIAEPFEREERASDDCSSSTNGKHTSFQSTTPKLSTMTVTTRASTTAKTKTAKTTTVRTTTVKTTTIKTTTAKITTKSTTPKTTTASTTTAQPTTTQPSTRKPTTPQSTTPQSTTPQFTTPTTYTTRAYTPPPTPPITCSYNAQTYCASGDNKCFCGIQVDDRKPHCYTNPPACPSPNCNSNADCVAQGKGAYCVYDPYGFCSGGKLCTNQGSCPGNAPATTTSAIITGTASVPQPTCDASVEDECLDLGGCVCALLYENRQAVCVNGPSANCPLPPYYCNVDTDCGSYQYPQLCVYDPYGSDGSRVCADPNGCFQPGKKKRSFEKLFGVRW